MKCQSKSVQCASQKVDDPTDIISNVLNFFIFFFNSGKARPTIFNDAPHVSYFRELRGMSLFERNYHITLKNSCKESCFNLMAT